MPVKTARISAGTGRITGGVEPRDCTRVLYAGWVVDVYREGRDWLHTAPRRVHEHTIATGLAARGGPSHPTRDAALVAAGIAVATANIKTAA